MEGSAHQIFQALFPQDANLASIVAVAYISLLPISMLTLFSTRRVSVVMLNLLVAFAVGALLGDVFLHLLPHAFSPHKHDALELAVPHHHHGHEGVSFHGHHHHHHHHPQDEDVHEHVHDHDYDHDHEHGYDHGHDHEHDREHDHHHHHEGHLHEHDHEGHDHHGHHHQDHGHHHHHHHHHESETGKNPHGDMFKGQAIPKDHAHAHLQHAHHHHHHHHHHNHGGHEDEHMRGLKIGLSVLIGFLSFFIIEKTARLNQIGHQHHHPIEEKDEKSAEVKAATVLPEDEVPTSQGASSGEGMRFTAYLNLIADAMHNLTDGLAIAAAFHASRVLGITTTVACFLHEIPHEIGDFAILLRSGVSKRRAVLLQLLTAGGAMLGAVVGNVLGAMEEVVSQVVLPLTAGGFIYIATVGVIPELLEGEGVERQHRLRLLLGEALMMIAGITLMAWIALNE